MKGKLLLALAGSLIVSMLVISPVSAQSAVYQAFGTINEYNPDTEPLTHARIIGGYWRIIIAGATVDFKAFYVELNVEEQIPGTYDMFGVVLVDGTVVSISGSSREVEGTLVLYKIGFHSETGEFGFWITSFDGARIAIAPSGIWIYLPPYGPAWAIRGSAPFIWD